MGIVPETDKRIAVIADDLTGANDTGVQFAKQGLKTVVLMGGDPSSGALEEDVVVLDSQSRALPPDEAYENVARAARRIRSRDFRVVFKKIDSTLRGNIGREIDAIMDTCGQEVAIVAPAFPKNGRITVAGYHFLQGAPIETTEISMDPKCPITESHVPTLLGKQTARSVGLVGIKSVNAGTEGIRAAMEELIAEGDRVIVCDAWEDRHLRMHADAAIGLRRPVLWVGSAGLAECLPQALGLAAAQGGRGSDRNGAAGKRTVAVFAGSVSNVTRAQLAMLEKRSGVRLIEMDACKVLSPVTAPAEIRRCSDAALEAAEAGQDIVVSTGYTRAAVDRTLNAAAARGLSIQRTAEEIASALGVLCREIVAGVDLKGLVLTGGDIALSACSRLSATGFHVVEEVAPGIPAGRLKGGPCDGLRVVTKAGAFGAEDALCKAVDCLKRERLEGAGR
ncbi:MAG: four-carbon acid sugar kinase family protein [Thermodesulfobacteriota bacterium]